MKSEHVYEQQRTVAQHDQHIVIGKKNKAKRKEMYWAYLFVSPIVLGKLVFYLLPAIASVYLSMTDWNGLTKPVFVGLQNFIMLLQDKSFLHSLLNTFLFAAMTIPLSICFSMVAAVLLNQKIKGKTVYRTIYFIPVITMSTAVGMIWRWIYNSDYGLLNQVLGRLGLPQPSWLFEPSLILFAIAMVWVWQNLGYNTVILLSGLQGISSSYYEAAEIDGCGSFKKFFYITLPLLTPSLFFVLIMALINSFQVFDLTYIMMGQATSSSLVEYASTIVFKIYQNGFQLFKMGYASAQAWVLFAILMVTTLIQMYYQKKWVHYQ